MMAFSNFILLDWYDTQDGINCVLIVNKHVYVQKQRMI